MTSAATTVRRMHRDEVQRFVPQLDAWLLPGSFYGVQHTWPLLYRRDGDGEFFVATDGDRLLSHCACRLVTIHDGGDEIPVCLLGSVATDPDVRGRGLASEVLQAALHTLAADVDRFLLWAERPELYARHGFVAGAEETCLWLARRPRTALDGVRTATIDDHAALRALHEQKPTRVGRSPRTMATLLTTPGTTTVVLERGGEVVAYACTGKGADLQGHWHELGGGDDDLALLLPAAMHVAEQIEAALLLPPYRARLRDLLGPSVVATAPVPGPMVRAVRGAAAPLWIDGLDSV
jgi:GNAT superfamily N-acetyltransferase